MQQSPYALIVHGGAGAISRNIPPEKKRTYLQGMHDGFQAGFAVLQKGGSALEAACSAVEALEDIECFNAGRGAVFNREGKHELSASIMDGETLSCGGVARLTRTKNPILLARLVMEHTPHALLVGGSADQFGEEMGLSMVPQEYFATDIRRRQWVRAKLKNEVTLEHSISEDDEGLPPKTGTAGAVALDPSGNLAAATSTGGLINQLPGRVADTGIIGAGTYADNSSCAVSCTGMGEEFIRLSAAVGVSYIMQYTGMSLQEALDEIIFKRLTAGTGGAIAIDRHGRIHAAHNSLGMYRAWGSSQADVKLAIWDEVEEI